MNLVAAYCRFWPPQMAISRYTGTSSSSQARKNSRKSWDRNTSPWADACRSSRAKYRRDLLVTDQLAATDSRVTRPLSTTSGADKPSAARDHSRPITGSQLTRSTSCKPAWVGSKRVAKTAIISSRSTSSTPRAKLRGSGDVLLSSPGRSGISIAPTAGRRTIRDSQGKVASDAANNGSSASIS